MKIKSKLYLIIPILLLACSNNKDNSAVINLDNGYSLRIDTIYVDIKGKMTHALKYQDKFYVLFEQNILKFGGYGKRWLYIISNRKLEKIMDCPKELNTTYLDFYAKNDSLIIKPYMDKESYYLDLNNYRWVKINKTDDLIFEDELYQVYSLDFGEWGGKTWFKEKKTGKEYVLEATTPLVNKIDSTYYLTNPFKVFKIENPKLLNKCNDDVTYENIETTGKYQSWYGEPIGFDIVYQDSTFDYFDFNYKPHIASSFVLDNELFHIYETEAATYIARHKEYSIEPIQKIIDNISIYNWHYSYRCVNLKGNNELLKFRTEKEQTFGLLAIMDHDIHVTYMINKALLEPKLIGAEKTDSLFVDRLNTILQEFNKLKLNTIDLKEQNWGSFDITPNHNIGVENSWNPNNYTLDTCKAYLVKEDSVFFNSLIYHGTKESNIVRVVSINWDYERNLTRPDSEKLAKKRFEYKTGFLIEYISGNIGKLIAVSNGEDFIERTWETPSGVRLFLSYNKIYYEINLVIYKK